MNARLKNRARSEDRGKVSPLSTPHSYYSHTTRLQAGDPGYVIQKRRERVFSLALHCVALLSFVLLSRWCSGAIAGAIMKSPSGLEQVFELFGAVLMTFLGSFAFMRLAQAALRAVFRADEEIEWPRKDVDWGKQAIVLDQSGIAIANRLARRTYVWDSMAQMTEDDVFVFTRKQGSKIVIPKAPSEEDELRAHLMYGLSLSSPLRRSP